MISSTTRQGGAHEVRHLLRALGAAPVDARVGAHRLPNALEQVRLADELGFDQVWAVEHHFLEEYSHCPAPELFLTACAMTRRSIRVGHGIVVCVPEFNHPIKIAERTAVLDILSGGRLEVGTGRSATWTELGGFQRRSRRRPRRSWDEFVRCLPKMWTQETLQLRGRVLVDAGARRSCPRCTSSRTRRCGSPSPARAPSSTPRTAGLGSLGLTFGQFAEQEKRIAEYRRRIQHCEPVGDFVNDQVSTVNFLYCHEDDADGRATGRRMADTFNYLASQLISAREAFPTPLVPVARSPAAAPAPGHRPGRRPSRPARDCAFGGPQRVIARAQALGGGRRRPRELPAERDGGHPAGRRAREPAPVRARKSCRPSPTTSRPAPRRRGRLMPTFGTLELPGVVQRLATMRDLDTEAWTLPGAEILQLAFEVPRATETLLPRAHASGHPALRDDLGDALSREPGGPVHPRPAPADGARRCASARVRPRCGREHGRGGDRRSGNGGACRRCRAR